MNNAFKVSLIASCVTLASCLGGGGGGGGEADGAGGNQSVVSPGKQETLTYFSVNHGGPSGSFPMFDNSYVFILDQDVEENSQSLSSVIVTADGALLHNARVNISGNEITVHLPDDVKDFAKLEFAFSDLKSVDGSLLTESSFSLTHQPIAQKINFPEGRLVDFSFSNQNGLIYVLTDREIIGLDEVGIFKSEDNGISFKLVKKSGLDRAEYGSLNVNPVQADLITTHQAEISNSFTYSIDAGDTWVTKTFPGQGFTESLVYTSWNISAKSLTVGNFRQTWEYDYNNEVFINPVAPYWMKSEISPDSPYSYATADLTRLDSGVYLSSDEGRNFVKQAGIGLPDVPYYFVYPADSENPASVFAGVQRNYIEAYYSTDYGNTFSKVTEGPLSRSPSLGGVQRVFFDEKAFLFAYELVDEESCINGKAFEFLVSPDGITWTKGDAVCTSYPHSIYLAGVNKNNAYVSKDGVYYSIPLSPSIKELIDERSMDL